MRHHRPPAPSTFALAALAGGRDGRAERPEPEPGDDDRPHVAVGPPVPSGDRRVAFGQDGPKDGAAVQVVRPPADDDPAARAPEVR